MFKQRAGRLEAGVNAAFNMYDAYTASGLSIQPLGSSQKLDVPSGMVGAPIAICRRSALTWSGVGLELGLL